MKLPAIDLGLMSEHLAAHEGVITKLKIYHQMVHNGYLKKILRLHIMTLRHHVAAMLMLIDPNRMEKVHLADLPKTPLNEPVESLAEWEKDIALESRSTAKLMGTNNYNSAAMMKNENVKSMHVKMAKQDIEFQMMYNQLIEAIDGDFVPMATPEMQWMTLQKYQHVAKE
jgi:tRNA(Glu) U13 pseudouridine synthase TruD